MPDQPQIEIPVLIPVDFYANLEKEAKGLGITVEALVLQLLALSRQSRLPVPAAEDTEFPD
jgi:hypothetical protein